jgi:hypothetical protein
MVAQVVQEVAVVTMELAVQEIKAVIHQLKVMLEAPVYQGQTTHPQVAVVQAQ